jgi:hypothetical protein
MVSKLVCVNYYDFNSIWVQNASIPVPTQVKKRNCQGILAERNILGSATLPLQLTPFDTNVSGDGFPAAG